MPKAVRRHTPTLDYSVCTREYHAEHPDIDFFVLGHRHIALDYPIDAGARVVILGDCFSQFSYAVYAADGLRLLQFENGES